MEHGLVHDDELFESIARARGTYRAAGGPPSIEVRLTPEAHARLVGPIDDRLTAMLGMPVVIDPSIPAEPGFEIRHRHRWSEWECMVMTSDFPMRRWCLAGARCEEQQTWLNGEPEPQP